MTIYTVHLSDELSDRAAADRAALVPDKFSLGAAAFGPLWLARHRAWRALAAVLAIDAAVLALAFFRILPADALAPLCWLQAICLGLEGQNMRRAALERRGLRVADVVSAVNAEAAERRFFERWRPQAVVGAPVPAPLRANAPPPPAMTQDILGVFPEADARR